MTINPTTQSTVTALQQFNQQTGSSWNFGSNWSNVKTDFETFVNKFLFPKLNETAITNVALGNRFEWLAREEDFVGQYSEEYVILDTVPVTMNLSKQEELMLKRNYPQMATKLYGQGILKKTKFTLNNNDSRLNFSTLGDATKYALGVYRKRISDINVEEEKEIKGMLVDYSLNHAKDKRTVEDINGLVDTLYEAILNLQNNSEKYNEADTASGGELGRYTTTSDFKDFMILTSDKIKTNILNSKIANTFNTAGLDITNRIISFDDLGGVFRVKEDVTLESPESIQFLRRMGDYQVELGDVIPEQSTFTFDVSGLSEFQTEEGEVDVELVEEIKPDSEIFAYIFDVNKLRYKRSTKGMLKEPFYNGETDEVTYWLHYYSTKTVSPFWNSVTIVGA